MADLTPDQPSNIEAVRQHSDGKVKACIFILSKVMLKEGVRKDADQVEG